MTRERWREIEELYRAALEKELGERAALLAQADPEVRREVESLLDDPTGERTTAAAPVAMASGTERSPHSDGK